jgi:hypothetical protein
LLEVIDFGVGQVSAQRSADGPVDLAGEASLFASRRGSEEDARFPIAPAQNQEAGPPPGEGRPLTRPSSHPYVLLAAAVSFGGGPKAAPSNTTGARRAAPPPLAAKPMLAETE